MKINSILIVGGGSSGWMTAAAIKKQLPNIELTLVESSSIPVIGVGESTIGHINSYMNMIGLKDEDWMSHCNATYKTSIRFTDFREKNEKLNTFHYPFGVLDYTDKPMGPMEWFYWKLENPEFFKNNTFSEVYHDHVIMANQCKFTDNSNNELRGFNFKYDTAYHMDAGLFGKYVKEHICIPAGMNYIVDDVTGVIQDNENNITGVTTKANGVLKADLYIDCTGFKSMLLEGAMGSKFESFHDTLLNDSAIATMIPYLDKDIEMSSVTNCTAIEAGWVWNIPLWNRIGTGYVYSSKFATEEEAEAQFRKHLASDRMDYQTDESLARAENAVFRHIKIKHGCHKESWIKNVIGIGLSNGFIEPLESTGLMLTHEAIIKMIGVLEMRNGLVTKFDIDTFNYSLYDEVKGFKDFIALHYALSSRNDTPYWKYITEELQYSPDMVKWQPQLRNAFMDLANRTLGTHRYDGDMGGIMYIAAGMGYSPLNQRIVSENKDRYSSLETLSHVNEHIDLWHAHVKESQLAIDKMPTHHQWLKNRYYKDKE